MVRAQSLPTDFQVRDKWIDQFLRHLSSERGASIYTQRNYRQALIEFFRWHHGERQQPPAWSGLQRDDFRDYLRFLGRGNLSRAAIQLRFCALRSFYKFLIRRGAAPASPIKNLALPKLEKRLPKFLGYFERVLTRNARTPKYLVGRRLTYVDLSLFQVIEGLRYAYSHAMSRLERACPGLVRLHDRVRERPRIAAYLASERRLPYNEEGIFRHYKELDV